MIQKGNYGLSFRRINEESTDGSGSVCHVGFYVISYVFGCVQFRKASASGCEGLHALLIPARTLPYEHTNECIPERIL